ncbi:MAG: T9SS type A sorting domain-containing protein [Crocinitomicaceae bacterium]|nr:T9SS type A sorting domain-containing protein [Crocinitomicaceae bacterium]MBP6032599.1 T9SS type A sorting domain-containing protein [Crocinitomicaceae bacterium]
MKNLLACLSFCFFCSVHAQICNIDFSQTTTGIYPDTLPPGNVSQAYSSDITFVMPLDTLGYNFTNFHILSVSLPVGLSWQCNNNLNNCDYNPQLSQYGCVHISGTPLLAGQYTIDVTVIADLTIVQDYPFTFQIYMEVLPSTTSVSNNGFEMTGSSGCAPITVNFTNNNPGMLSYFWDFGNGNISSNETPAPQVFTSPGAYIVNYMAWNNQDTTDVYTLTNVHINNMSNYGNSFPSYENADAYFKLFQNGIQIYQSSIIGDQNPPIEWNTSINLNPTNTFIIEIWEADESFGETYFGADDFMGSHTLNLNGCNGCGAGTSNFNYSIQHQIIYPSATIIAQDTVHVYGYPLAPNINYDQTSHTLSTPNLGFAYQWYFNGSPIAGATNASHVVYQSGIYNVIAINPTGCVNFSDTLTAVYCNTIMSPSISLNSENALVIANYPASSTIEWYVDGVLIQNQENDTLNPQSNGTYSAQISDSFGCSYFTNDFQLSVSVGEVETGQWMVYPNPVKDLLTIQVEEKMIGATVELLDLNGRSLTTSIIEQTSTLFDVSFFPSGTYFLSINKQVKVVVIE